MNKRLTNAVASAAIITAVCLLTPIEALADPSISSSSGTFAHGSSVTITGSGFGTKNPAKPVIWANFENGAIQSDPNLSVGILQTQSVELTTQNQASNSTYSLRGRPTNDGAKQNVRMFTNLGANSTTTLYISNRRYYDHANFFSGVTNYKWLRVWPQCASGFTNFVLTFLFGSYRYTNEGTTSTTTYSSGTAPLQIWLQEEYELRHGDLNTSNAIFRHWENGVKKGDIRFVSRNSDRPDLWGCPGPENFWTNDSPPNNAYVYFDDFYLDTTWARVMIGNASTFAASTHREPQIPTAWSSNSITISVNQGAFPNFNNVYLYVVDPNGRVNSTGFPLSVEPPPNPPQNLRIQP